MPVIRTPDQRLRVFVSSTLAEMAPERAAVRAALEALHLAPVMFELGARPHPPRELYRAYLAQSHVFLGLYWQRYGWVAPDETASGLEDEYRLSGHLPRLIYIKEPSPEREPRLKTLLAELKADDRTSYKRFGTPEELARLVTNDLVLMLTERFEAAGAPAGPPGPRPEVVDRAPDARASAGAGPVASTAHTRRNPPPLPLTPTVGREAELALIADKVAEGARLVTLTGPGGIGKTRLAIESARALKERFPGGVHYLPLASVSDPALVARTLADRLGLRIEGSRAPLEGVAEHLDGKSVLLVLDNLEQVAAAGPELAALLEQAEALVILSTSRHALRLRGEHEVPVPPLPAPDPAVALEVLSRAPAVRLFVARARQAMPAFELTPSNAPAVAALCRRLDGLPLALELAAARARLLPPARMLERLGDALDWCAGAAPDLPERQRTLRATIDWSHRLLDVEGRRLFSRLSVFAGGCTLEAAEAVCGEPGQDVLGALGSLVDKSLLVVAEDVPAEAPRFRMLETVRTYGRERLEELGESPEIRARHLAWYRQLAEVAAPFLCGPDQRRWEARMELERDDLRTAVATALDVGDDEAVVDMGWHLLVFYWLRDEVDELERWFARVEAAGRPMSALVRAKLQGGQALLRDFRGAYGDTADVLESALAVFRQSGLVLEAAVMLKEIGFVRYVRDADPVGATAALEEATRLFESVSHDWGTSLTESMLGSLLADQGALEEAERHQRRSLEVANRIDNDHLAGRALQQLGTLRVLAGRPEEAPPFLAQAAARLRAGGYRGESTGCLDVLAAVALARGDAEAAARAVSVAEAVRGRLGLPVWPTARRFVDGLVAETRARLGDGRYDRLAGEGDRAEVFAVLEEGLGRAAQPSAS